MNDLAKQLEDGRAARRARVTSQSPADRRQSEFVAELDASIKAERRAKRFSQRTVNRICREIELGIQDCKNDMPEVPEHDAAHDIAWSMLHFYLGEHPDTLRAVCNRYGVSYGRLMRRA